MAATPKGEDEKLIGKTFLAVLQTLMTGLILYFVTSFFNGKKEQDKELLELDRRVERNIKDTEYLLRTDLERKEQIKEIKEDMRDFKRSNNNGN